MKYRPSNGTEGMMFMSKWCEQCERDAKYRETQDGADACEIASKTMYLKESDSDYPIEWTYDNNGKPCCTAFLPECEKIIEKDDKTIDMFS